MVQTALAQNTEQEAKDTNAYKGAKTPVANGRALTN